MRVLGRSGCLKTTNRRQIPRKIATVVSGAVLLSLASGCMCDGDGGANFSKPKAKPVMAAVTRTVKQPEKRVEIENPDPKKKELTFSQKMMKIKKAIVAALQGKGRRKWSKYNREDGQTSRQNVINLSLDCNRTYNEAAKWSTEKLGINWTGKWSRVERMMAVTPGMIDTSLMSEEAKQAWLMVDSTMMKRQNIAAMIDQCIEKAKMRKRKIRLARQRKTKPKRKGDCIGCDDTGKIATINLPEVPIKIKTAMEIFGSDEPGIKIKEPVPQIVEVVRPDGTKVTRILPSYPAEYHAERERQKMEIERNAKLATLLKEVEKTVGPIEVRRMPTGHLPVEPGPLGFDVGQKIPGPHPDANNAAVNGSRDMKGVSPLLRMRK